MTAAIQGWSGFFDPGGENVLRMSQGPAVGQEFIEGGRIGRAASRRVGDGREPAQLVGQVRPDVDVVPPGALHDRVQRRRRPASVRASQKTRNSFVRR